MNIALLSTDIDVWAPGIRGISAFLKAAGYSTQLAFMTTNERLFSRKALNDLAHITQHADIIGVSCLARGSAKAKQLIEFLHRQKKLIIWGGIHASLNPVECADWADIVCRGEGEGMMLDLLERMATGKDWHDVKNAAYKENGILTLNDLRPPISDLDKLPFQDFTFENEYHLTNKGLVQVSTLPNMKDSGQIIFNSSRGCAFHCTYCCNVRLKNLYSQNDRYIRRMSIPRLIEHSVYLRKTFPSGKFFYFIDEDFAARPVEELVQLSVEFPQKVGLPFQCLTHPARVTHQKIDLLVKAGLFIINMGIESGSKRTRTEIYDRHVSNEAVKRATQILSCYPTVLPEYFFIIANPYEEENDLIETIRLISELPQGCLLIIYNLVFFPGSNLYDRAVKEGFIEGENDSGYELDFLGGLNYSEHAWKKKNLYLNGLIFLMDGFNGRHNIGILPRSLIHTLLLPHQIKFFENRILVMKALISIKLFLNSTRHMGVRLLKRIIGNPIAVFNLGKFLRKKVSI